MMRACTDALVLDPASVDAADALDEAREIQYRVQAGAVPPGHEAAQSGGTMSEVDLDDAPAPAAAVGPPLERSAPTPPHRPSPYEYIPDGTLGGAHGEAARWEATSAVVAVGGRAPLDGLEARTGGDGAQTPPPGGGGGGTPTTRQDRKRADQQAEAERQHAADLAAAAEAEADVDEFNPYGLPQLTENERAALEAEEAEAERELASRYLGTQPSPPSVVEPEPAREGWAKMLGRRLGIREQTMERVDASLTRARYKGEQLLGSPAAGGRARGERGEGGGEVTARARRRHRRPPAPTAAAAATLPIDDTHLPHGAWLSCGCATAAARLADCAPSARAAIALRRAKNTVDSKISASSGAVRAVSAHDHSSSCARSRYARTHALPSTCADIVRAGSIDMPLHQRQWKFTRVCARARVSVGRGAHRSCSSAPPQRSCSARPARSPRTLSSCTWWQPSAPAAHFYERCLSSQTR